mmetsp:Transcript_19494/g.25345  ORF Transcript_19494/g.25345 Transcript_19494/m.25345 type:complete len:261 (-) Transcript_19494:101-883(-)
MSFRSDNYVATTSTIEWCLPSIVNKHQPEDVFFAEGNILCQALEKFNAVAIGSDPVKASNTYICVAANCGEEFTSRKLLSQHFVHSHLFSCRHCSAVLPTHHLLELHAVEFHDSYFQVASKQRKMYECLVNGCKKSFWDSQRRMLHLVSKHAYPKTYSFGRRDPKERAKACKFFQRKGGCNKGESCKFWHSTRKSCEKSNKEDKKVGLQPRILGKLRDNETTISESLSEDEIMGDLEASIEQLKLSVPDSVAFGRKQRQI